MSRADGGLRVGGRILEFAILIALPILFHYLIPGMVMVPKLYSYFGYIPMAIGLALVTWAGSLFRKVGTSFQLHGGPSLLVTSGPFRFSRNPMYLGMLIWLVGLAILLGSLITFLFPLLFFFLAKFFVIPLEEKDMAERFGEQYTNYKRLVRRWV